MEALEEKIRIVVREELKKFEEDFFIRFRFESLPPVNDEEQRDIEKLYGDELLGKDETDIAYTSKLKI